MRQTMRHKRHQNRSHRAHHDRRRDVDEHAPERERFEARMPTDPYGRPGGLSEGRDFYGYNFGDYRDFEGRDPDTDIGGRGPDWDEEAPGWSYGERGGRDDEGSDIRGYEGGEYRSYGGGYEGYYGEEEGRGPDEYESWRWGSGESFEPVGEWSSRHSHDFEHPGFEGLRGRGEAPRRGSLGQYARPEGGRRRRRIRGYGVGGPGRRRSFRGVAPKGYTRSDSAIYEDVCAMLEDAEVDPSNVTVSVEDREVMLSGTVDDRWAKRYIEDLAYSVRGVTDVVNKLRVEPREHEPPAQRQPAFVRARS